MSKNALSFSLHNYSRDIRRATRMHKTNNREITQIQHRNNVKNLSMWTNWNHRTIMQCHSKVYEPSCFRVV